MLKAQKIIALIIIVSLAGNIFVVFAYQANAAALWYFLKEFIIKPLVRKIANALENQLANKLTGLINGVTQGTPNFITNWRNHILDSQARGNDVFRAVLADTKLCPYFKTQLQQAFGADKYVGAIANAIVKNSSGMVVYRNKTNIPGLPSLQASANCGLPSSFDAAIFKNDFAKGGGWDTWNKLIQPQNNFFGAYAMALDEQANQTATEETAAINSAVAGQGFLSQRLGKNSSGSTFGPTGCITENALGTLSNPRCTFLGKEITPAQILGKGASDMLDKKLGRVGGATELTDIVLNLFAAVLGAVVDKITNYIGQIGYDQSPSGGTDFSETEVPTTDPNYNNHQICMDGCMKDAENTCTIKAKVMNCDASATGGSGGTGGTDNSGGSGGNSSVDCHEIQDNTIFNDCMSEARASCDAQCPATTP